MSLLARLKDTRLINKKQLFPYNSNKQKLKLKNISFTTASKNVKYLGKNMRSTVKNLFTENFKILLRD